jgi:hypothetical protein
MINETLAVWITGHSAAGNTLWPLKNRDCAAKPGANRVHARLSRRASGAAATGDLIL